MEIWSVELVKARSLTNNSLTPKSIQEAKRIKTLLKTNTLKETANKLKLKEKKLKGKIKYLKKKGLL